MSGRPLAPTLATGRTHVRSSGHERVASSRGDQELHARLLERDPLAPSDLALAHLAPLSTFLRGAFPKVDPDLLDGIAIDLILALAERPEQYDPRRGTLAAYLRMAARGDVKNALRSEGRRARRLVSLDADVELARRLGNTLQDETLSDLADLVTATAPVDAHTLARLREGFEDLEWSVVQLMLEGERSTATYARLLGLEGHPEIDQAREVKRVKDRLQKRLRRLAPKVRRDG